MKELAIRSLWLTTALLCCSTPALAEDETEFEVGLRLGFAIPMGTAVGPSTDLSDVVSTGIPIEIDAGVRFFSSFYVGTFFQYGFALLADNNNLGCSSSGAVDLDCSGNNLRLGIQAHYHIFAGKALDPWVGLGFGYEWLTVSAEGGDVDFSTTLSGFEFLSLQLGLDIEASEHLHLGPFASFSFAQYDSTSVDCSGGTLCATAVGASGDIPNTGMHNWLILGVRGAFAIGI